MKGEKMKSKTIEKRVRVGMPESDWRTAQRLAVAKSSCRLVLVPKKGDISIDDLVDAHGLLQ